jgi:hypothetical protein
VFRSEVVFRCTALGVVIYTYQIKHVATVPEI